MKDSPYAWANYKVKLPKSFIEKVDDDNMDNLKRQCKIAAADDRPMDRETAIEALKELQQDYVDDRHWYEALRIAIRGWNNERRYKILFRLQKHANGNMRY